VRIEALTDTFHGFGFSVRDLFEAVGADYNRLCRMLEERQKELIAELAASPAVSRQAAREMVGVPA
jgi:hypothetical protein